MWRVGVFIYKAFKYTIYFLLIVGLLAGVGCPMWCEGQITEIEQVSPFDE